MGPKKLQPELKMHIKTGDSEIIGSCLHKTYPVPDTVGQHYARQKEKWIDSMLHRISWPEQSMPKK